MTIITILYAVLKVKLFNMHSGFSDCLSCKQNTERENKFNFNNQISVCSLYKRCNEAMLTRGICDCIRSAYIYKLNYPHAISYIIYTVTSN